MGQTDVFLKQESPHNPVVFLEETERGRPNPIFPGVQETTRLINEALIPVWKGQKSAREAIEEVVPLVNSLLSQR